MGLPARKPQASVRGAGRGTSPHLRLAAPDRRPPQQAASGPAEAACRSAFQLACVVLVALACFGLARVGLSAKVAEASIDAVKIEHSIKAESQVADQLEMDRSMLVTPSRIESLAAGFHMTKTAEVRYLAVPSTNTPPAVSPEAAAVKTSAAPRVDARQASAGILTAALQVTEKEARALLVGDVGLAASR